ncbi:MAG TPA: hypothetical protein VLV86_24890, partial [Vicinamibacterales bacterium]|nr:hypothetical protein [Vicinamibacterales bacterium]
GLSVLLGAALGIGFGFRTDVMVNLAPFVVAIALFAPGGVLRPLRTKLAALALCLAAFWIAAGPVITNYQWGNAGWHLVLLGTTDPFDRRLGVSPSIYSFGNSYSDDLVQTIVKTYAWRVQPDHVTDPGYFMPEYEEMTRRYFFELARTFPADFAIRSWGSVIKVLNLPFSIGFGMVPIGVSSPVIARAYRLRSWLLTAAEGVTPALLCALILVLATDRPRYALALTTLLLFFAAYPVLQYDGRHVFHLEFLALWIDALTLWWLLAHAAEIRRRIFDPHSIRRIVLVAAAMALMIFVPIAVLRLYQRGRVQALLAGYAHDPEGQARVVATKVSPDTVRLEVDGAALSERLRAPIAAAMLAVRVGGPGVTCRSGDVELVVRYLQRDNSSREDFSHVVHVPTTAGVSTSSVAYIPVYVFAHNPYVRFAGIEVPHAQSECIAVSRLEGTDRLRLLLETVVAERSEPVPLYQRLSDDIEIAPPHIRSAVRRLSRILRHDR